MNFSEPGCAATTNSTFNSSTPLHFARSLFTGIALPPNISNFTRHLTAIRDAAYLLLLPQTCRAEVEFHQAETSRISNGPLGDDVLLASTLFFRNTFRRDAIDDANIARMQNENIYEATDRMLLDLAAEQDRYMDNMTLLLADMKEKWRCDFLETGSFVNPLYPTFPSPSFRPNPKPYPTDTHRSWHRVASNLGESGIESAQALSDLVGHRPTPPPQHPHYGKTYLSEIARYWRTWGQADGAYEEIWTYVSGRALVQE